MGWKRYVYGNSEELSAEASEYLFSLNPGQTRVFTVSAIYRSTSSPQEWSESSRIPQRKQQKRRVSP